MGMDVLDIVFRLEKAFGIKVARGELERHILPRNPPDFRVTDLLSLIRAKWPAYTIRDGVLALVDTLGVDAARVHDDASISRDLGAS